MKKLLIIACVILLIPLAAFSDPASGNNSEQAYFFVQMAEEGEFDGNVLKLKNISPAVAYFSNAPYRVAGHMKNNIFLEGWEGDNFKEEAPQALVTLFWDNATIGVVVKLTDPHLEGNNLNYNVEILGGSFPKKFRIVSIFFDPMTHYDEEIE